VGCLNTRPTNPRWWTAAILEIVESRYLRDRLADFDKIWHDDAYLAPKVERRLKLGILKIEDGGGRHNEKSEKLLY